MLQNKNIQSADFLRLRDSCAGADVRVARMAAHKKFDRIWKLKLMRRDVAYRWLAAKMGLPKKEAHISLFTVEQCLLVEALAESYLASQGKQ